MNTEELSEIISSQAELIVSLYEIDAPSWRIEVEMCALGLLLKEREEQIK